MLYDVRRTSEYSGAELRVIGVLVSVLRSYFSGPFCSCSVLSMFWVSLKGQV